jgi:tetratricopeptide (TPR) repeat protein
MRAAFSCAIADESAELALRLSGALQWFWFAWGYYDEGSSWLEQALLKKDRASTAVRAKGLDAVGWLAHEQGDIDRATAAAEKGLKLSNEAGVGNVVVADLRHVLGESARQRGDYDLAMEFYEEALDLYQEPGDRRGVAWSLGSLASAAGDRGDHERAKRLYEEGLALSRRLGGARPLGAHLLSLGYEFLLEGDLERATELNEEAAALLRKQGRRGDLQYPLVNLGWAGLLQGDHERAEALYKESLRLCRELGDRLTAAESLEGLACTAGAKGDARRAARLFGAAETLRKVAGYQQAPRDRSLREPYLASAHAQVDEAAWSAAWEEGRFMEFDDAVVYALEDPDG